MKEKFVKVILSTVFVIGFSLIVFNIGYYQGGITEIENMKNSLKDKVVIEKFKILPVDEKSIVRISSNQGLREMINESEAGGATSGMWHNGVDIACPEKTPVMATKGGEVISVYPSYYNGAKWKGHKVYGGLVIVKHSDCTITLYAHLSRTDVKEGEIVQCGQKIGLSGGQKGKRGSGISTGCHLHYAIYPNISELTDSLTCGISN